jgi:carbon-monoxide dehydrogenase large subunit
MYLLERLIDTAARKLKMDPVALRRKNLIPQARMPYKNPLGMRYDSGDFLKSMEMALHLGDWSGFPARRAAAKSRDKLAGIGIANYIETATGQPVEWTEVEVMANPARIEVRIGTQDSGQGHDTTFSQLIVDWLGVPFDQVRVVEGDTDVIPKGSGSHSSRSMRLAGVLIGRAKDGIVAKGKKMAAQMLEAAEEDIEFANGRFRVAGTDRDIGLFDVAAQGKLSDIQEIDHQIVAFPNGCHVCEVEVDPDTGQVEITRYTAIDDVGRVINPLLVDGQTHGGIAHGVGQALYERVVWSPDNGQLLSGSFMDYCLPKADTLPPFKCENNENLSKSNPLGIKGAGEGGATGAPPAIINAVVDALAHLGVTHIDMPATPETVWRAIRSAGA